MTPRRTSCSAYPPESAHSWNAQDAESARRLSEKITEARRELGFDFVSSREHRRADKFTALWNATLPRVKALSIDIFDTALVRTLLDPQDVFLFLKDVPPFTALALSREQIFFFRREAERAARAAVRQRTDSVEATLTEIYDCFAGIAGVNPSQVPELVAGEQAVELFACRGHPKIQGLIQEAVERGKMLLFVSDTYHSRDFLCRLLVQAGYSINADQVFASCDYREGKYSGTLLLEACKSLHLNPADVAHLGDNAESDEKGARIAGMPSLLHPFPVSSSNSRRHQALDARRIESLLRGTALATRDVSDNNAFWFQLGSETFGPLLVSYILWLGARFRRDKIEHAYFLLRDGFILHQIYEVLRETRLGLPPSSLLYSSRRAFAVPALGCKQTRNIDSLLVSGNSRPAGEFLSRLDLDPNQFIDAFTQAGFSSPGDIVDHREAPDRILHLFRDQKVLAALSRRALLERKLLVRYLAQENVTVDRPTALIDIGWNNTVQKSLLAILDEEKVSHQLHGYYLGTLGDAQDPTLPEYRYQSYLCHDGEPVALSSSITSCRVLLEIVCTSFQGSLHSFTKKDGKIELSLDPIDTSPSQCDILHIIHEGILSYARNLMKNRLPDALHEVPAEIAAGNLIRLLTRPTPDEARHIGALEHGDGVGSPTRKPLAAFGHESLAPRDLLDSYENAYWKRGLLAMDTTQALVLQKLVAPLI